MFDNYKYTPDEVFGERCAVNNLYWYARKIECIGLRRRFAFDAYDSYFKTALK